MSSSGTSRRDEIRAWAFADDRAEPHQDYELALANTREFDLFIELAADDSCPARDYFLRILYQIVGGAVMTKYWEESEETIAMILEKTERYPIRKFEILRQRSASLIEDPELFDYGDWCSGGFVTRDLEGSER